MPISRLRLYDFVLSRGPSLIGLCQTDIAGCADAVNSAQERLLTCSEAGDTGWWGGYAEIVFNVNQTTRLLTLPRGIARVIKLIACQTPMPLRNQFYEYLDFGSGRWPKVNCDEEESACCRLWFGEGLRRNVVPTITDLTATGQSLRIYSSAVDNGKTVIVSCLDSNGLRVTTTTAAGDPVDGIRVTLAAPSTTLVLPDSVSPLEISAIVGLQKDETQEAVSIYQLDIVGSTESLLTRMEPGETVAAYQRYYLNALPSDCCDSPDDPDAVQVTAICKLDLVPARVASDYLLIQSVEALISECQSARKADMDSESGQGQSMKHHRDAIRYLQGQLVHYEGKETVAIKFSPFGSAHLSNQRIGQLM